MQKALTMAALILVCIAAASVAYYFGGYLPRLHDAELAEKRRVTDLDNARRCDSDGRRAYAEYIKLHAGARALPGWEINWDAPETHYSKLAGTCLLEIVSVQRLVEPSYLRTVTPTLHRNQVSDVYHNRVLFFGSFERTPEGGEKLFETDDPDVPNYTSAKYFAEKDKLFNE